MDCTLMKRRRRKPPDQTPDLFSYVPPPAPVPSHGARNTDPQESHDSAKRVAVKDVGRFSATTKSAKLLVEFDAAPNGLTHYEAMSKTMPPGEFHARLEGCRRRCSDLKAAGYIEKHFDADGKPQKRHNPGSPDKSAIWFITEAGRAAIKRLLTTGLSR